MLPWSCKLLFSSVMDSIKIAGSQRKAYLVLASILGLMASIGMFNVSSGHSILFMKFGEYKTLMVLGLFGAISMMVSRLLFDTIIVENAANSEEKAILQLHSRNAMIAGGLCGAILAGPLVHFLGLQITFLVSCVSPLLVFLVSLTSKYVEPVRTGTKKAIGVALLFILTVIGLGILLSDAWGQFAIFGFSLIVFGTLLYKQLNHLTPEIKRTFLITTIAVFMFRVNVDIGAAGTWYYQDVWKFDDVFFGLLGTTGYLAAIIAMFSLSKWLINIKKITPVLISLTVATLLLSLPDIMIYYGYTFGMNVRHMVLLDSAGVNAIGEASMVPLGVLIAMSAPEHGKVTYFALIASLMNLCLLGGSLIGKYLNTIFVVSRGHYENLGKLLIFGLAISVALSILGIGILMIRGNNETSP